MQQKDKIRVYTLAHELGVDSKLLLQYCKELGFEVKNQLNVLNPEQCEQLLRRVQGGNKPAPAAAPVAKPVITNQSLSAMTRVRDLSQTRRARDGETPPTVADGAKAAEEAPPLADEEPVVEAPEAVQPPEIETPPPVEIEVPVVEATVEEVPPAAEEQAPSAPAVAPSAPQPSRPATPDLGRGHLRDMARVRSLDARPVAPPSLKHPPATPKSGAPGGPPSGGKPTAPPGPTPARPAAAAGPTTPGQPPGQTASGPPAPAQTSARAIDPANPRRSLRSIRPPVVSNARPVAQAPLRGIKPLESKPKENVLKPMKRFETEEQMRQAAGAVTKSQVERILKDQPPPGVVVPAPVVDDEDDDDKKRKHAAAAGGGIPGRNERHEKRKERAQKRKDHVSVIVAGGRVEEVETDDNRARRRKVAAHRKLRQPGTMPRAGKVPIASPITVRALSEAIGWKSVKLLFQLIELGAPKTTTINSVIDDELAETVALEANVELEIRRQADAEERLMTAAAQADNPEEMVLRAPIVTIMGHVDHGKTSLLDKIRSTEVAKGEIGGITQVIRAWRVEHGNRPITFLDTPGHEAFTQMRARGAKVTDIAVIVVAVTDGVQPQTEEAIAHAKAAGVQLIVALNKIDMPNANLTKTRQQLYSLGILPDNMGGDTPFVETSAATGQGIGDLLDTISVVAELRELKANPNKPAGGTCIEAHLEGDEGVFATLLVQQGTLRKGDAIMCGASYGRVRAMYNDQGLPIQEAGPSVPVRITGLDEVPEASDSFHVVPELSTAREIAEKRKDKRQEATMVKHQPMTLESLAIKKVTELKVILKADFRGSVEAIRKELDKLQHEEVKVRLLHAGIGAITESDVQLALTSPEDTLIVGFNAVPDNQAKALAEARGVQIREYGIIYNLTGDIKAAMEGKLKPREEIIHLGRAVVRDVFKISRVGTVAGCYVTQGTIERSAKVRLIREGLVVYPPAEKTASLDSLRRFKEDVREVREGFDCGIKIAGYDDVKVGDVIEAYRIEQVKRTLA